jgi:membrane-associated protease RseP (regulator of RpoE activity)
MQRLLPYPTSENPFAPFPRAPLAARPEALQRGGTPLPGRVRYRVRQPRAAVNAILFLLTLTSVTYWGFIQYQGFYRSDLLSVSGNPLRAPEALLGGLPFAMAVIAFLLAHEMGHYLACRYYGIAATLPYFIPFPPIAPPLPGTMGAVIRIVSPITSRRALFDIAVAGPLAGFVVAIPILAVGLSQSRVVSELQIQTGGIYIKMGEPLIWGLMENWFGPTVGSNQELLVHPLAFVGWFALLVTAMNLLPVGQLDGGHLLYALFPRWHQTISKIVLAMMLLAGFLFFPGWVLFSALVFFLLGTRHPRPLHFDQELGGARVMLALIAALILVSSFVLVPVTM